MPVLQLMHMAISIFSSLVVALVVGWMILRASPGFLGTPPGEEESTRWPHPTETERKRAYARWFVAMRWIAVLLAGVFVFVSVQVVRWLPQEVWCPLVLTVAALAAVNLLYTLLIRWNWGMPALLLLQGYIDLLILTVLLHFSGGLENPLSMMMLFHVIIGGILLSRRQCYGIAAAASVLFALLALAEWAGVVKHYTLQFYPHLPLGDELLHPAHHTIFVMISCLLQAVVLFLTAYFVTTLAERLRYNERRLEAMADQATADRQLLERALESTGAALRVLDRELLPRWASNRWNEWFNCPAGANCSGCELLTGKDSPARQSLEDGRTRVTDLVLGPSNCLSKFFQSGGGQRVFQVTTAPLLDGDGNLSQVVELARDVTQEKQTQAQMIRAGKLAAVGELAGKVAHEVNNPIAIIGSKARLLLSDHDQEMSPKIAQELVKIRDLADRVARIAQGLLSYCRPSTAARVPLDMRVPIRKSLAIVEQHARSGGVRIEDRLPDSALVVRANANELEQVFLNLFLNALDAMPQGGTLKIWAPSNPLSFGKAKQGLAVVVEDTGIGIAEGIREKVFEPFFTTKEDGRGTGLGLSICLGLVRSHGGGLQIESELGQGTRVTVSLPVEASAHWDGKVSYG